MTPWPFRDFGGEADTYIGEIGKTVESLEITPAFIGIAGYSLGGLFALYSMYRTTLFSRFASASGSLWYPGFSDFVLSSKPLVKPERIYLSLGDKEPKAGNALMRSVGERTAEIFEHYQKECFSVRFESNPGNHFTDTEKRMAKGKQRVKRRMRGNERIKGRMFRRIRRKRHKEIARAGRKSG